MRAGSRRSGREVEELDRAGLGRLRGAVVGAVVDGVGVGGAGGSGEQLLLGGVQGVAGGRVELGGGVVMAARVGDLGGAQRVAEAVDLQGDLVGDARVGATVRPGSGPYKARS